MVVRLSEVNNFYCHPVRNEDIIGVEVKMNYVFTRKKSEAVSQMVE